jgi:hypothetical protein
LEWFLLLGCGLYRPVVTPLWKLRRMNFDAGEKACAILQRLRDRLHDATVHHRFHNGAHEFAVRHGGFRFTLRFPEQALLRRGMEEIEQAAAQIVERIRLNSKAEQIVPSPQLG